MQQAALHLGGLARGATPFDAGDGERTRQLTEEYRILGMPAQPLFGYT
jgi:hypothetical protein